MLIRNGISPDAVTLTAESLDIPINAFVSGMGINPRTFMRWKSHGILLNEVASEKILRINRVLARAKEVFGTKEEAVEWLQKPAFALDDHTPLSILDTGTGEQIVMNLLNAIYYGVYL
jgi:putative toxin-antitoxin system antitoxin component (TIGR02293 family)